MQRYCLALDLINDPKRIAEYDAHHRAVWPEVRQRILSAGIHAMEIYRVENRLFMIMETTDDFSFEAKALADRTNEKVLEWENLMWHYQQPLPFAKKGEKWVLMDKIFSLTENNQAL